MAEATPAREGAGEEYTYAHLAVGLMRGLFHRGPQAVVHCDERRPFVKAHTLSSRTKPTTSWA